MVTDPQKLVEIREWCMIVIRDAKQEELVEIAHMLRQVQQLHARRKPS